MKFRRTAQTAINLAFLLFFVGIFLMPLILTYQAWKYELGIASLGFLTMYWWVYDVCKAYKNPTH